MTDDETTPTEDTGAAVPPPPEPPADETPQAPRSDGRWNRLSLIVMGAGVASLAAAAVLFVLILTGSVSEGGSDLGTVTAFTVPPEVFLQPTPVPPSDAGLARIVIPRFQVNAPLVVRGVDANGVMQTPDGPTDVAWYDFSARPGFGGNAVFSGHVDYHNYGAAVFWNLRNLEAQDVIEVHLQDGTVYTYKVFAKNQIYAANADVGAIVGPTAEEVITLITCGGTFNSATLQYDQRVVVRASRVSDGQPPSGLPAGAATSP